ncbi:MAG: MogA/MoaB family molybdenum cofactor biosynthesis protein [Mobilitalea sp.]
MRVAIITSSDSGYVGQREDLSGPVIRDIVEQNGYEVVSTIILPDKIEMLMEEMSRICDEGLADLILTTGGTGLSPTDCMPEATEQIGERRVPGIPEAMRQYSLQFTKRAMLSRAACVTRKSTLILNLPGSPKAVRECLEYVISELEHGLLIMLDLTNNCARK